MNAKSKALSNAMGAVLSARSNHRANKYNRHAKVLTDARKYDNAPNFDENGPTPAFKARLGAEQIKNKYKGGVK